MEQLIILIANTIADLGFPIVITGYLLLRFEKRIEILNNIIMELQQVIRDEVHNRP